MHLSTPCLPTGREHTNKRAHEPMSPDPYGEFFSPYLAMGNNPLSTVDPDGGKVMRSGTGAAFDVDYQGRERKVEPFDMVGGSGTREEKYGWSNGKLISLEDDPYSPYTLDEQISGRISSFSNRTSSSNSNQGGGVLFLRNALQNVITNISNLFSQYDMVNVAQGGGGDYLQYEAKFVNATRTEGDLIWYNSSGEVIATYPAVSGSGNPKYYSIPEGTWNATYLNTQAHPKYSRHGVSFRITLGPDRYDPSRGRETGLIRIHPARYRGTEGCIGLIGDRANLLDFYNRYSNYYKTYGTIPVKVNYLKP